MIGPSESELFTPFPRQILVSASPGHAKPRFQGQKEREDEKKVRKKKFSLDYSFVFRGVEGKNLKTAMI